MERNVINARRTGRSTVLPDTGGGDPGLIVVLPGAGAGEWEIVRRAASPFGGQPGALTAQVFASLDAVARQLVPGEAFVLEVPLELGLVQRFVLPAAEPAEIEEMARIQLEKILPYPAETVGLSFCEVERSATEVVLAVEAVHHDRLVMLSTPLTSRGCWPSRVLFHARAVAAAVGGNSAFICAEAGKSVLGIAEAGRLSFAQALSGTGDLATELPAVLLGAELEGVPADFAVARLDERRGEARAGLEVSLGRPVEIFDAAAAAVPLAAAAAGDLSPPGWRVERLRIEGRLRLKRRILLAAAVYLGLLALGILLLLALKIRLSWLESRIAAVKPAADAAQAGALHWKSLAPAIDPPHYVIETLFQVYQCLPPGDVIRLITFDVSPTSLTVQGEAPSPGAAVEFTEKLKSLPELRKYRLNAEPPTILPTGHARFRVSSNVS